MEWASVGCTSNTTFNQSLITCIDHILKWILQNGHQWGFTSNITSNQSLNTGKMARPKKKILLAIKIVCGQRPRDSPMYRKKNLFLQQIITEQTRKHTENSFPTEHNFIA